MRVGYVLGTCWVRGDVRYDIMVSISQAGGFGGKLILILILMEARQVRKRVRRTEYCFLGLSMLLTVRSDRAS